MNLSLKGVGVALVTPFTADNKVDTKALSDLVENLIENKVDYLVVLGTTAETATLSKSEKELVKKTIIETNKKRLPLVLGIGGNNTENIVDEINSSDLSAFTALLSVTPYYNKPNQGGLYEHYKKISENSPIPIILYNVPSRTGVNMLPSTSLKLARDFKNIVAIKEASGSIEQITELIKEAPDGFKIISGDDNLALSAKYLGAEGVISVAANALPKLFADMFAFADKNDLKNANKILFKILKFISLIFKEGNPVGIKAALKLQSKCFSNVRLPLVKASDSLNEELKSELYNLKC